MNENNNTPDKITIKVRHWDEDYHDITIDWSNESFDYRKQVHHQLSAYTGIPVGYQYSIDVQNTAPLRGVGFYNAEFLNQERRGLTWQQWHTKESAMDALQDGDCFLFKTRLLWDVYPSICCSYELLHRDLVNETGCDLCYCQHLGSRFFTNKFSQLIKYEQLQTLLDAARFPLAGESFTRARLNVNVEHLARLQCSAVLQEYPDLVRLRDYYLRYRG